MNTSDPCELSLDCKPGDSVQWTTSLGHTYIGVLRQWEGLTAIVEREDGAVVAV